eukprot:6690824-Alexandrium_andersonii.AAC.1
MSASLVGSEMCIRDRCSCESGNPRKPASGPRPGVTRLPDRAANVKCPPCLLYTSDAADDM